MAWGTRYRCADCDQPLYWEAGRWYHQHGQADHDAWPGRWCPDTKKPPADDPRRGFFSEQ